MIDASTVISAALNANGMPRRALATARAKGTIALSNPVFSEIAEVLRRPKFERVLTADRQSEIMEMLAAAAIWTEPTVTITECRDAKDNKYLELALAARASAIVSGDTDLLVMDPWRAIRILRPVAFLEGIREL